MPRERRRRARDSVESRDDEHAGRRRDGCKRRGASPARLARRASWFFLPCGGLPPRHFYLSARRRGVPGLRRLLPRGAHRPFCPAEPLTDEIPAIATLSQTSVAAHGARRAPAPPARAQRRGTHPALSSGAGTGGRKMSASRRRLAPGARDDVTLPPNRAIYDGPRVDTWSGADAGVEPRIVVEDAGDNDTTLVRCQGFDRTGQLAALTIALSSFGLQIKSTFIRTDNDAPNVDDLFYVQNREGEPVSPSQHAALVAHMERALAWRPPRRTTPPPPETQRLHPRPRTRPRPGRRIRRRFPERRARRRRRILRRLLGRFALRPGGVPLVRIQPRFGGEFGRRVSRRAARTRSSGLEFLRRPAGDGAGWPHGVRRERRGGGQWLFRRRPRRQRRAGGDDTRRQLERRAGFLDSCPPAAAETQTQTQSWTNTSDDVASRGNSNAFDWGGSAESTREREPATDFAGDDACDFVGAAAGAGGG